MTTATHHHENGSHRSTANQRGFALPPPMEAEDFEDEDEPPRVVSALIKAGLLSVALGFVLYMLALTLFGM